MNIRYLDYAQRKKLEKLYAAGKEISEIAEILEVNPATIYRELKRGAVDKLDKNGRITYSADVGQKTLNANFRRRYGKSKNIFN